MITKCFSKIVGTVIASLVMLGAGLAFSQQRITPAPGVMLANVPLKSHEVIIDGRISELEWGRAASFTGLVGAGRKLATRQTVYFCQWQPDSLWVAARGFFPAGVRPVKRNLRAMSDTLEMCVFAPEDQVEKMVLMHLFAYPDGGPVDLEGYAPFSREFIRANLRAAAIQVGSRVEVDPEQTLGAGTQRWEIELRIPMESLQRKAVLKEGETVGLMLGRNFGTECEQTYLPVVRGFFDPTGFMQARLVGAGSAEGLQMCTLDVRDGCSNYLFRSKAPHLVKSTDSSEQRPQADWLVELEHLSYVTQEGTYLTRLQASGVQDSVRLTYRRGKWTRPRLSPVDDRVLVTSYEGGKPGIWCLEDFGRKQRRLADGRDACWVPDGAGMVFEREGRLYSFGFEGPAAGRERDITPAGITGCRYPVISRRGSQLAFVAGGSKLVKGDMEAQDFHVIASGDLCGPCAWSPDGSRLAFQDGPHLWMIDERGGRRLLAGGVGVKSNPLWEKDGRAVAMTFSQYPDGPMQWRAVAVGSTDVAASWKVMDQVNSAVDGVWRCVTMPEELAAALAGPAAAGGRENLRLGKEGTGAVQIAVQPESVTNRLERRQTGFRIAKLDEGQAVTVTGPLAHLIVVDRLSRDVRVLPSDSMVNLDFASLIVCPLAGEGGLLVVANPARTGSIRAKWQGQTWSLVLGTCPDPIGVGLVEGAGQKVWVDPASVSSGTGAAIEGRWRYVGGASNMPVVSDALAGGAVINNGRMTYLFERTQKSPLEGLTVADVVQDLWGLNSMERDTVLQQRACLEYRVAGRWTAYPSVGLFLDSIVQAARPDQLPFMANDIPGWCEDAEAILEDMDQRLTEYAQGARRLELPALLEMLATRTNFVPIADLKLARTNLIAGGKLSANGYLVAGRKAAEEREKMLVHCRSQVVTLREVIGKDLLAEPDLKSRAATRERWTACGALLVKRHIAEGQWFGEPVVLPYSVPWWQGNMWSY